MQTAELETVASHAVNFQPRRFLSNGHLQTIAGNYFSRANDLPTAEEQLVEVSPATMNQIASQVLCHCHWQPEEVRVERPTAIIVHGLEGSSNSQYVIGNANKLARTATCSEFSVDSASRVLSLVSFSAGESLCLNPAARSSWSMLARRLSR